MIARLTVFAVHATPQNLVMCCDGDPGNVPPQ
jgi:hypothetical protein